jgi:hypothetical protein
MSVSLGSLGYGPFRGQRRPKALPTSRVRRGRWTTAATLLVPYDSQRSRWPIFPGVPAWKRSPDQAFRSDVLMRAASLWKWSPSRPCRAFPCTIFSLGGSTLSTHLGLRHFSLLTSAATSCPTGSQPRQPLAISLTPHFSSNHNSF